MLGIRKTDEEIEIEIEKEEEIERFKILDIVNFSMVLYRAFENGISENNIEQAKRNFILNHSDDFFIENMEEAFYCVEQMAKHKKNFGFNWCNCIDK